MFVFWLVGFIKKQKAKPHKAHTPKQKKPKKSKKQVVTNSHLQVCQTYMVKKEILFWKFLNLILPKEYIAVPKVALCNLLMPDGDKTTFNQVSNKCLDFVIFNATTMYPALVIDIYDNLLNTKLDEFDPLLTEVLNNLNLKVVHIFLATDFNTENAKKDIYSALSIKQEQ